MDHLRTIPARASPPPGSPRPSSPPWRSRPRRASQADDFITVASTTSTEQSGLFKYLLPEAKKALGFDVRVVAVGTGQALDMARRGDADVVFVHDKAAEEKFLAEGFGVKRYRGDVQRLRHRRTEGGSGAARRATTSSRR